MVGPAASCVGCETQGRPGRSGTANVQHQRSGNRHRRSRRREPPRRLSGGQCGRSRRQSRAARCRRPGRKCPHWCGHDCTAQCGAWCAAKPAPATHGVRWRRAEAKPEAGAAGQGERSEFRREAEAAVTRPVASNEVPAVSVRHTAGSAASRRASGARSERERTEARGIAEEIGAKRRLERKARPRSGSPDLDVAIVALVNIVSTTDSIVVFTIVVSFRVTSISGGNIVVCTSAVTIGGDGECTTKSSSVHDGAQTLPHSTRSW